MMGFYTIIGILVTVKLSTALGNSCPVSPLTVQIVEDCPNSEQKWMELARRKNCTAYASQCDEPQRLVYHCVINEYANQTLEVCAYGRIIVSGYCTEYNYIGNRIQQNFRTNCSSFTQNPCPSGYPSNESYKYPGCFKLAKGTSKEPAMETTHSIFTIVSSNSRNQTNGSRPNEDDDQPTYMIFVATGAAMLITAAIIFVYVKCRRSSNESREPLYCLANRELGKY